MNTRMLRCKVQGMKLRAIRLIGVQSMVGQQVRERRRQLGQQHMQCCVLYFLYGRQASHKDRLYFGQ